MASAMFTSLIFIGILTCALGQLREQTRKGTSSKPNSKCECVDYLQCTRNGVFNLYGADSVNPKSSATSCNPSDENSCDDPVKKCCCPSEDEKKDEPYYERGCGFRNQHSGNIREMRNNSNLANEEEFPWMIYISIVKQLDEGSTSRMYKCGGSLIHRKVVLTAAHCIENVTAADLEVRAGEWDVTKTDERHPFILSKVSEIKRHPNFNYALKRYNFALLILSEPFEFTYNIETICLPEIEEEFNSKNCIVTGWGKPAHDSKLLRSNILKAIKLPTVAMVECENRLIKAGTVDPNFALHDSLMCAGGIPGYDSCYGDGGSPLVCPMISQPQRYVQAGIVTWGVNCNTGIPAIYAKVSTARQWIDGVLKNLTQIN